MNLCLQDNLGLTKIFNSALIRIGRNTPPDSLGNGYLSRRSKGPSKSNNRGHAPSHKKQYANQRKPYEKDNTSYGNGWYGSSQTTQTNRQSEQYRQPQQSQNKNAQSNDKNKGNNNGKGKRRNFQKQKMTHRGSQWAPDCFLFGNTGEEPPTKGL